MNRKETSNTSNAARPGEENEEIALTVGKLCVELEAHENNLIDSECHVAELEEALRDSRALLKPQKSATQNYKARMHTSANGTKELDLLFNREKHSGPCRLPLSNGRQLGYAKERTSMDYNTTVWAWRITDESEKDDQASL